MSPSTNKRNCSSLYDQVRWKINLRRAWAKVRQKGLASKSYRTREQTKDFDAKSETHLNTIQSHLQKRKFVFSPADGIPQKKPGKPDKRPIVISPTRDRVVQRAILDVLQKYKPIEPFFKIETSFGGIKDRGVPDAIALLHKSISAGGAYFVRSDIKSFFTKIPKSEVIRKVEMVVSDAEFIELLAQAIRTELANLESLSAEDRKLFPLSDVGVAQGSSLSPLAGNLLLADFDKSMNQGDITCIRYIDDFIILGPSRKAVLAAFRRAQKALQIHGLEVYDPELNPDKAEVGNTSSIFTFLGCDLIPGMIQPSKKSRLRLLSSIDGALKESSSLMGKPNELKSRRLSLVETLISVNNILMGWGNQYAFCNNEELMNQLDDKVDIMISNYLNNYRNARIKALESGLPKNRRKLIGIHLLTDSKKLPIISPK